MSEAPEPAIFGIAATVQAICNEFTSRTGLILLDLSLNNIRFN